MKIEHDDLINLGDIYEESAKGRDIDLLTEDSHEKVTLSIKRLPETDEWKVQYVVNGKVDEDKSYYASDKEDAEETMKAMQKEIDDSGTVNEGFFDRVGDRVASAAGTAKDAWGNVKASAKNVKQTMSGDKPTGRGKNLAYQYDKRKADRVINRHLGKIKNQLSEFATDLTKLGVVTADEAEQIAQQAYSAVEKSRTLKKTKNLYDV
jgi:hypothetical protein